MAGHRIFGSKPGAYGAGLQALIDEKIWTERGDLAARLCHLGRLMPMARAKPASRTKRSFAAAPHATSRPSSTTRTTASTICSTATTTTSSRAACRQPSKPPPARSPRVYHNDHSRPERPVIRTLEEEIGRVMRSRVVNPKWIAGVKRHGYKGAFEIAATVDYMFAFAATTGAVKTHHFDLAFDAFVADDDDPRLHRRQQSAALTEIAERFEEAVARGLWTPRSNSAYDLL